MGVPTTSKTRGSVDPFKMASAYLTLWKALDVHFPGHEALEVTQEKVADVTREVEALANEDLAKWAEDQAGLIEAIRNTLKRLDQKVKDQAWFNEARILKDAFRDRALEYSMELSDPPPLAFKAIQSNAEYH